MRTSSDADLRSPQVRRQLALVVVVLLLLTSFTLAAHFRRTYPSRSRRRFRRHGRPFAQYAVAKPRDLPA